MVVFGASAPTQVTNYPFKIHYLGTYKDDLSLSIAYSAADVMLVPSVYEVFGQTASEAMACGTPVVAFATSGLKDIVDHQQNGYLARAFDIEDLARGIQWILEDIDRYHQLCDRARKKVETEFNQIIQSQRYLSLFNKILTH